MREHASVEGLITEINRVEAAMKEAFAEVRWSFFEPENSEARAEA
jgi:hypothetical protein